MFDFFFGLCHEDNNFVCIHMCIDKTTNSYRPSIKTVFFYLHCSCPSANKSKTTTTTKVKTEKRKSSKKARTCGPSLQGFLWLWDSNKTWVTVSYIDLKLRLLSRQFNNNFITSKLIIFLFFWYLYFLFMVRRKRFAHVGIVQVRKGVVHTDAARVVRLVYYGRFWSKCLPVCVYTRT